MVILFLSLLALSDLTYSQNPSPCPEIFSYEAKTENDKWYGVLSIRTLEDLTGVYINILLDRPAHLLGNWFGDTTSSDNTDFVITNQRYKLEAGPPVTIRFFVKYNSVQTIPSIKSIRLNGRTICSAKRDEVVGAPTTEKLHISHPKPTTRPSSSSNMRPSGSQSGPSKSDHPHLAQRIAEGTSGSSFHHGSSQGNNHSSSTWRPSRESSFADNDRGNSDNYSQSHSAERPSNSGSTGNSNSDPLSIEDNNNDDDDSFYQSEILNIFKHSQNQPSSLSSSRHIQNSTGKQSCGTVPLAASPLIAFGQDTKHGQWPWHAALYYSKGIQLIYSCGATLITDQHVLTAAHCITRPHTTKPVNIKNLRVYLGKHNLVTFGNEVQERGLSDIYVHPDYNHSTYFNDIAVLKLSKLVDITNYVRACCLWDGDSDLSNIIDKQGTVVGWGFDQQRQLSNKLMQAQMPVISTVKCIYSNRDFFSQFTFENNFCAGFRNGTSVCNGDSGGGMVFPKKRTSGQNTVWQIRGIVSVGVALQGQGFCDTSQYIVFTDVAKYTHWIRQVIAL